MAGIVDASYQGQKGGKDRESDALLGDAIFDMRGLCALDVGAGIGSYGRDLDGPIRRCRNNEKELLRGDESKRIMSNRAISATTQLKFGSGRVGAEGSDMRNWEVDAQSRGRMLGTHSSLARMFGMRPSHR